MSDQHHFSPNNITNTSSRKKGYENSANVLIFYQLNFSHSEKNLLVLDVSKDQSEDFVCGFCDFFPERFYVQISDVIKLHVHA